MLREALFDLTPLCIGQWRMRARIGRDAVPKVLGELKALGG